MSTETFDPNRLTFEEGLKRIEEVAGKVGMMDGGIVTSKDESTVRAMDALEVTNVPSGFKKWQLPVSLGSASQMFVTVAEPGADVPSHSHKEGDGIRFIAGGSILYEGKELTAGDWMFIPAGEQYSFEVGRHGAIMCYCYSCCCA